MNRDCIDTKQKNDLTPNDLAMIGVVMASESIKNEDPDLRAAAVRVLDRANADHPGVVERYILNRFPDIEGLPSWEEMRGALTDPQKLGKPA